MANLTDMLSKFINSNTASSSGTGTLPSNTVTNPKEDLKGITTQNGVAYKGPMIPTTSPKVVDREARGQKDTLASLLLTGSIRSRPTSGYLSFEISFTDALMIMPKFASTLKALIGNKKVEVKWLETPLKRFACPTCMTLELADRSISEPIGIAEDVYVTVGKFQFPADFVVVDFEPDPRVPLILGRSFLKTSRALIDVYEGEITLRVGREAITFNLDQTSRYTANYNHMTANRIDVIDMACEEYSQEVLGFSNVISSGNPTPYYDPIVSTSSPTLTPFGDSDFLLFEEADSFLASKRMIHT
ncbi:reverse transcriptase domain-containing protein [Tanacetum coccineum]